MQCFNDPGEDFCGECGGALAGNAPAVSPKAPPVTAAAPEIRVTAELPETSMAIDGERKTVTALFADIKGSMELIEDIDPEEARRLVDPALKLMMDAVHRYEGYVAQSTGDGIFALFGAPVAHEDHPQRALLASLKMQEDIRKAARGRARADRDSRRAEHRRDVGGSPATTWPLRSFRIGPTRANHLSP